MSTFPLRLDRYFFTESVVTANPSYDPDGSRIGSVIVPPAISCSPLAEQDGAFGCEMIIQLDESKSENPPYFFSIHAFAILVATPGTAADMAFSLAHATGLSMLVGAIREHLASITARGPWGPFLLSPVVITPSTPSVDPD